MEIVRAGLIRDFNHLVDLLFSVGSEFSLTSLDCALAIAGAVLVYRQRRKARRIRLRALMRALFPRRIVKSPSSVTDFGYFLFNTFVYGGIFGMAAVSYQFLTNAVIGGLVFGFGAPKPSALPEWVSRSIVTLILFLAYEFGYWIDHYLKHRIPVLWELHKVHHTAEVLTPLTTFRMHPFDTWIFGNILAVTAAIANGLVSYMFGNTAHQYVLSGNNVILVIFIHVYVHLQHTHLWISFRGWLGRIFISPAHHQVHHSTNPIHFNKNLGSCLAIWDWLFGTLHVPSKSREKLSFGVEPAYADANTITGELLSPIGRAFGVLVALFPKRAPRLAEREQA